MPEPHPITDTSSPMLPQSSPPAPTLSSDDPAAVRRPVRAVAPGATLESADANSMHCPTCRARQQWSETCRRCGSDLTLLRRFAIRIEWYREQCLLALHTNDVATAWSYARALYDLRPDADATRLLGTCLILNGEFEQAQHLIPSAE
jgi:hypothetical protein